MRRLTTELADLRAAAKQELARLGMRSWQGGPFLVVREGALLAAWKDGTEIEVTPEFLEALRRTKAH